MYLLYLAFRLYPVIALCLILVLVEVAFHYRRKRDIRQWYCVALGVLLFISSVVWLVFRGDLHSDDWLKAITGSVQTVNVE